MQMWIQAYICHAPFSLQLSGTQSSGSVAWIGFIGTHFIYMPSIHQSGMERNVFTAVLAHCTPDIKPPPCLPVKNSQERGKTHCCNYHGRKWRKKTSFCGVCGHVDLMESFMCWSRKEEVSLVILSHLIIVGVFWHMWIPCRCFLSNHWSHCLTSTSTVFRLKWPHGVIDFKTHLSSSNFKIQDN